MLRDLNTTPGPTYHHPHPTDSGRRLGTRGEQAALPHWSHELFPRIL